jgi:hypothetical protein
MRDYIDVGPAPPLEDCAQVGTPDYWERARCECRAYVNLLRRVLGQEPDGARLTVRSHPHDFGSYLSAACEYDPSIAGAIEYAMRCESDGPQEWDEQARSELSQPNPGPRPERR